MSRVNAIKTKDLGIVLSRILQSIGNINDLNSPKRPIIIKVGVFNPKREIYTSISIIETIVKRFNKAPKIFLVESDNS